MLKILVCYVINIYNNIMYKLIICNTSNTQQIYYFIHIYVSTYNYPIRNNIYTIYNI
jgi:hypothetical protein